MDASALAPVGESQLAAAYSARKQQCHEGMRIIAVDWLELWPNLHLPNAVPILFICDMQPCICEHTITAKAFFRGFKSFANIVTSPEQITTW